MDLDIIGRHALLFDDDATATFVSSGDALVPWSHDSSLLIDRYDVRHLLDRIPSRVHHPRPVSADAAGPSEVELDRERYLDLPPPRDGGDDFDDADLVSRGMLSSETTHVKKAEKGSELAGQFAYRAVPFAYDDNVNSVDSKILDSGISHAGFLPPFSVPESLLSNLPPTEKLHQIIARTALFVSEHGGQSEIVLRVKQGDNPTFGFLMPNHHLHAYYRFLVEHPILLKADTDSTKKQEGNKSDTQENEAGIVASGALSLLGSAYGSVEDDDSALQANIDVENSNVGTSGMENSSTSVTLGDKSSIKHQDRLTVKDGTILSQKKQYKNASSMSDSGNKKGKAKKASPHDGLSGASGPLVSATSISDNKQQILEPPSFLKRVIEKIVEFIRRNGKDFESVLIEQDKTVGRFPFLLPTNQYHPYYLQVLKEVSEFKLPGKNLSDQKHDSVGLVNSSRVVQGATTHQSMDKDIDISDEPEQWSYDPRRKEKFRMVIYAPKKDAHEREPRPAKPAGVSADEAAAIVLAATRGVSPANFLSSNKQVGMSSLGSLSSLRGDNMVSKPASNSEGNNASALKALGSPRQLASGNFAKIDDADVAETIVKTAALAASTEADSSEVDLSKEQKLKAERLKRAKIFAAMIKGGCQHPNELIPMVRSGSLEHNVVPSTFSGTESDSIHKEREGSSMPHYSEVSGSAKSRKRDSACNYSRDHKSRKKHSSKSRYHESDSDEDHRHSRKKHHSEHPSHQSKDNHKHRNSYSSKESRHHEHRHYRSSEDDEHRHRKSFNSRRQHRSHEPSDVDDYEMKRSERHRRKPRGCGEVREEVKEVMNHLEEAPAGASSDAQEIGRSAGRDAETSIATEVPSELRAKIRAMLLENM